VTGSRTIIQDTITGAFARAVDKAPDNIFLDFSGEHYSYAEIAHHSTEIAHGLLDAGVVAGEIVATMLDNSLEAVTAWLAINMIGAVNAPVNTAFKGSFLRNQLNDCATQVVITENEYGDRVTAIADELPGVRRLVTKSECVPSTAAFETTTLEALRRSGPRLPVTARPEELLAPNNIGTNPALV